MPVEPRRLPRKPAHDESIEVRRARGEISCAECRRLKLRCDKKLPCSSCVRRGCTTICPNGSLTTGKGTKFPLADSGQLNRKVLEMSERIRQLEDALAILQASVSADPHPLLKEELLTIKSGLDVHRTVDDEYSRNAMSQTIDAFGTLTIGEYGETSYIGRSGSSETMFLTGPCSGQSDPLDASTPEEADLDIPDLDWTTEKVSFTFPFTMSEDDYEAFMDKLQSHLPPQPRAWTLCETYLQHFSWWFRPIKRDELINDILVPVYRRLEDPTKGYSFNKSDDDDSRCPHLLAVLYMVLALGALVDLTLPACGVEAETYYRVGRAALSTRSIFDEVPAIETVQAIGLMASYHSLCSSRYTLESAWTLISLACKLGQAIGLHRDSSAWKLDHKTVQRRRNLFWELFMFEMMHSVALGRPPSLSLSHVDCELPTNVDGRPSEDDDDTYRFWKWRSTFTKEVYSLVMDALLSAKAPPYEAILDLDRKIRQTSLPPVKLYLKPEDNDYSDPYTCMKGWLMSQYRSFTMLYIHRTFYAQALLDYPENPLSSPYAPSFLAANRCASVLIRAFLHTYERCPDLAGRFWGVWTHAFSSAVILGSTVCRSPGVSMAAGALTELELVLEPFAKGAVHSRRARQAYAILRDLKIRAERSYRQYRDRHIDPSPDIPLHADQDADSSAARLAIFAGKTRVVTATSSSESPASQQSSRASSNEASVSSSSPSGDSETGTTTASSSDFVPSPPNMMSDFGGIHPSLVEYLSFPTGPGTYFEQTQDMFNPPCNYSSAAPQPQTFAPFFDGMQPASALSPFSNFLEELSASEIFPAQPQQPSGGFDAPMTMQDLGFTDDAMSNDHWMNLMRETGVLDSTGQFSNLGAQEAASGGHFAPQYPMY